VANGRHRQPQPAGEQFARPIWDAIRDLEIEYKVYVHVDITATGRRGVLEVRVVAYDDELPVKSRPICATARDWPTSEAVSFPGLMFALVNSLVVCIRDHRMDELMRQRSMLEGAPAGRFRKA
jgi:hypothetical protein